MTPIETQTLFYQPMCKKNANLYPNFNTNFSLHYPQILLTPIYYSIPTLQTAATSYRKSSNVFGSLFIPYALILDAKYSAIDNMTSKP